MAVKARHVTASFNALLALQPCTARCRTSHACAPVVGTQLWPRGSWNALSSAALSLKVRRPYCSCALFTRHTITHQHSRLSLRRARSTTEGFSCRASLQLVQCSDDAVGKNNRQKVRQQRVGRCLQAATAKCGGGGEWLCVWACVRSRGECSQCIISR